MKLKRAKERTGWKRKPSVDVLAAVRTKRVALNPTRAPRRESRPVPTETAVLETLPSPTEPALLEALPAPTEPPVPETLPVPTEQPALETLPVPMEGLETLSSPTEPGLETLPVPTELPDLEALPVEPSDLETLPVPTEPPVEEPLVVIKEEIPSSPEQVVELKLELTFITDWGGMEIYSPMTWAQMVGPGGRLPNLKTVHKNLVEDGLDARQEEYTIVTTNGVPVRSDRSFNSILNRYLDQGVTAKEWTIVPNCKLAPLGILVVHVLTGSWLVDGLFHFDT